MKRRPRRVQECVDLTAAEFRRQFFDQGRPVLMRSFLRGWAAASAWTPAELSRRFGAAEVAVVHTGLADGASLTRGPYGASVTMPMAEFAALCAQDFSGSQSCPYLVAQSRLLQRAPFSSLLADLAYDCEWFDREDCATRISLWMGPAGAVTPLHFDLKNVLLAQAHGCKRVLLVAPDDSHRVYRHNGGYSAVNPENPDLLSCPLYREVIEFEAVLGHTDALYIPRGWWHHVRSLSTSISLSMSHFAWST